MTEIQRKTTRAYLDRRHSEGKTKREAIRCLKRHLARRIWPPALHDHTHASSPTATTHQHHHRRRSGPHAMHPLKPANSDPPLT